MTATYANPEDLGLKKFLVYSLILHGLLVVTVAASIVFKLNGQEWGGLGGEPGSVNVKLVGPAPGIPLPPKPSVSDSTAVDPTNSLFAEQPPPKPLPVPEKEPPKPAEKLQPFKHEKPLPETHKSKLDKPKMPPPDNAVPGNNMGTPKLPSTLSAQPTGGGSGQPVTVQGQGGGEFALRYAWYVEAVRRSVGQHWLQNTIDPAVRAARQAHCVMTFRIYRDGSVRNIQMDQPSGNLSMDNSARRALDGIQFGPLPNDYSGSYVDVTFDFDLALTH